MNFDRLDTTLSELRGLVEGDEGIRQLERAAKTGGKAEVERYFVALERAHQWESVDVEMLWRFFGAHENLKHNANHQMTNLSRLIAEATARSNHERHAGLAESTEPYVTVKGFAGRWGGKNHVSPDLEGQRVAFFLDVTCEAPQVTSSQSGAQRAEGWLSDEWEKLAQAVLDGQDAYGHWTIAASEPHRPDRSRDKVTQFYRATCPVKDYASKLLPRHAEDARASEMERAKP